MKKIMVIFLFGAALLIASTGVYLYFFGGPAEEAFDDTIVIAKMNEAEAFYRNHPQEFKQAVANFEQIVFEFPDTQWSSTAEERIREINATRQELITETWNSLSNEADALAESDSLEGAIEFLNTYTGPFSEDLKNKIKGQVLGYYRRIKALEDEQDALAQAAGLALDQLIRDVAKNLYEYKFREARKLAMEAPNNPVYKPVEEAMLDFCVHAEAVILMPDMICANILRIQEKNKTEFLPVPLKKGVMKLRVLNVDGTNVKAERIITIDGRAAGSTPEEFTFYDLSIKGQAQFLGRDKSTPYQIMRALILIQAKQYEKAERFLTHEESQLAESIQDLLKSSLKAADKPVMPSFKPVFEPDENNVLIVL